MAMTPDRAEIVALHALGWLASADLLDAFQGATGADRAQIAQAAGDPVFLAAVMDFVLTSDGWVQGACAAQDLPFEQFLAARAALPGGDLPHWT
ncbi:DUF3572 family protein [Jannaschia seohaensis]|uniref:Uncharacterized protein DUF3572 n=1 Tax=Jannaschia seohaensis TaxID=475081 RepID=A0A2Y9ABJ0_9RHOB|nr:DUF3572 family protein [Jannaschia seohaensis]PWJ21240.1 uncharacterized protein DUF3572 [Jannaschia seohaensis]SSA41650.1 Protein of unknown function [Jannaschia seohaensis]